MEGRICFLLVNVTVMEVSNLGLQQHADHWGQGLVQSLLQITHQQWNYCNLSTHVAACKGLNEQQQLALMKNMQRTNLYGS